MLFYSFFVHTTLDTIKIKVVFYMWEVNDGYQDIYLYNGNTEIWSATINRSSGKDTASQRFEYTIELNINTYRNVDFMDLKFGSHGNFGDTWQFNNFEMTITITN